VSADTRPTAWTHAQVRARGEVYRIERENWALYGKRYDLAIVDDLAALTAPQLTPGERQARDTGLTAMTEAGL
jgi:hypothetical protein